MEFHPWALVGALGFGGLAGAVVGYGVKKLAKLAAIGLALLFILIQVLAYYKFVHVDWGAVSHAAGPASGAAEAAGSKLWKILTYNLPFGGGFAVGFALGLKKG